MNSIYLYSSATEVKKFASLRFKELQTEYTIPGYLDGLGKFHGDISCLQKNDLETSAQEVELPLKDLHLNSCWCAMSSRIDGVKFYFISIDRFAHIALLAQKANELRFQECSSLRDVEVFWREFSKIKYAAASAAWNLVEYSCELFAVPDLEESLKACAQKYQHHLKDANILQELQGEAYYRTREITSTVLTDEVVVIVPELYRPFEFSSSTFSPASENQLGWSASERHPSAADSFLHVLADAFLSNTHVKVLPAEVAYLLEPKGLKNVLFVRNMTPNPSTAEVEIINGLYSNMDGYPLERVRKAHSIASSV